MKSRKQAKSNKQNRTVDGSNTIPTETKFRGWITFYSDNWHHGKYLRHYKYRTNGFMKAFNVYSVSLGSRFLWLFKIFPNQYLYFQPIDKQFNSEKIWSRNRSY